MRSNVRRALVTGAARGVGHATSLSLADRGYEVVGVDIRAQRSNGATATISADLSDPSECDRVIAEAGRIDVLVNAHGLLEPRAIESTTVEDFDRAVSVNLRSVFLLCQGSAPSMAAEGWGRIINFSSVVARTGGFSSAPYAAAKAGVIALTKSFATAYSGRGVTCNAVAPAAVDTELNAFLDEAGTPEDHRSGAGRPVLDTRGVRRARRVSRRRRRRIHHRRDNRHERRMGDDVTRVRKALVMCRRHRHGRIVHVCRGDG